MELWIFDVDGVLRERRGALIVDTVNVIHDLQQRGDLCTVATGLGGKRIWEAIQGFKPNAPLIVEGGARIITPAGVGIVTHILDPARIKALAGILREQPVALAALITVPGLYRLLMPHDHQEVPESVRPLVEAVTRDPDEFIAWAKEGCTKVSLMAETGKTLTPCGGITWARNEGYYDITALGVSKGSGVVNLVEYLDMSLSDVSVVGNDENDVSMFELSVQRRICVGEACPELIRCATHLVLSPHVLGEALRRMYL